MIKKCVKCGEEKEHQAKGMCYSCYKKFSWKPKEGLCKRCGRNINLHAKGLCGGCYQFVFNLGRNKAWNVKKWYGLNSETYKEITKSCVVCGFEKVVDLHHLDENHKNNSKENMVGLCPNHHKMVHDFRYRREMRELLSQSGYTLPIDKRLDFKIQNEQPRVS